MTAADTDHTTLHRRQTTKNAPSGKADGCLLPCPLRQQHARQDTSSARSFSTTTRPVYTHCRGRITGQAVCGTPGSRLQLPKTIRAYTVQYQVGTGSTKGALERTNPGAGRVRRKRVIAAFTGWTKFQHRALPLVNPVNILWKPRSNECIRPRYPGSMVSGIFTAITWPRAQTVSPARTLISTITLRSLISTGTPRSSSSTPMGVGAR